MADAPYKIGDFVVLDTGERGEITHIGIRSTRLKTRDDVEVTVPNSVMGNTKIINESGGPHEKFRIRVAVGVAYGSDIDKVREILMDIALNPMTVCEDPEPRVSLSPVRRIQSRFRTAVLDRSTGTARTRARHAQLQGLQTLHRRKSRNPLLQARSLHQANARVSSRRLRPRHTSRSHKTTGH